MKKNDVIGFGAVLVAIVVSVAVTLVSFRLSGSTGAVFYTIPLAVSIVIIPLGILRKIRQAQVDSARKNVPEFLRDLSDYTMYGTPLADAVIKVSTNDYGSLTPEVTALARGVKSGRPVEEALSDFGRSLRIADLERIGIILKKAGESGSNTSDVISMISHFTSQLQLLREDRIGEMRNYNLILMISYAVFFIVILLVDLRFFHTISVSSSGGLALQSVGSRALERIFDIGIYAEAVGIGIIIGMIKDRNPVSGFLEMGAMLLISSLIIAIAGVV